jgi:serine/threonine-protein kinase
MRRLRLAALLSVVAVAGCGGGGGGEAAETGEQDSTPSSPRLQLPYELAVAADGTVYVADGLLHRVLRHDPSSGQTTVVAGSGRAGSTGDGGPATEATLEEPVGLAFDPDGNLYVVDLAGSVRRVAPDGVITTLADGLEAPAAVTVHPSGDALAVPTLGSFLYRIDLASGAREVIAGDGTDLDAGDGGPAAEAQVETPHGADYDAEGNLYLPAIDGAVRRIDAATGVIDTLPPTAGGAADETFKIVVAPDGSLYLIAGSPAGGVIRRLAPDGTLEVVVGTGTIGPAGDGMAATEIGILPSDAAVAPDGALLFSQTQPEPAVRRVDPETGLVETLFR